MENVLVYTPVLRLEPESVSAVMALEWRGPLSFLWQRDNPTGDGYQDHLHQYQRARDFFLKGDYDAMLVIESDVIPPPDTLQRLTAIGADVAYGCYMYRHGKPVVNILERYPQPARNTGESLTVRGLWNAAKRKGVIECSGGGLGCVLIQRPVLEKTPFRLGDNGHCDHTWTLDVYQAGWTMKADTAVICGHKTPDGNILYA